MATRSRSRRETGARVPVPRARVAAGAGVAVLVLGAIVGLAEWLNHPAPGSEAMLEQAPDADPRVEVRCPEPEAREGFERDEPTIGPPRDVVDVTSNDLHDCPATYDGRLVRYRGEAIGAALPRGGSAWVQLNDDVYADPVDRPPAHANLRGGNAGVGVLVPRSLADGIAVFGGPGTRGDLVEVVGIFHRVDPRNREVAVIRADTAETVRVGQPFARPRLLDRWVAAVVAGLAAAAVVGAERVAARRR